MASRSKLRHDAPTAIVLVDSHISVSNKTDVNASHNMVNGIHGGGPNQVPVLKGTQMGLWCKAVFLTEQAGKKDIKLAGPSVMLGENGAQQFPELEKIRLGQSPYFQN